MLQSEYGLIVMMVERDLDVVLLIIAVISDEIMLLLTMIFNGSR